VSRQREIRNQRAQELQGLRAGFVSRAVASGIDVLLVLSLYVGGYVVGSIAWDLFFSQSVSVSVPPHWLNETVVWVILVAYLTAGWGTAGRSVGKQVMGLRVIRSDGSHLRLPRAFLRAILCATFFPVLLLALLDRRNRGLEDIAFGTAVAYDWFPEEPATLTVDHVEAHLEIEARAVPRQIGS
jgi:uncharacterized RDD family membrane protein YckC